MDIEPDAEVNVTAMSTWLGILSDFSQNELDDETHEIRTDTPGNINLGAPCSHSSGLCDHHNNDNEHDMFYL